jgi:hypothetical protein
MTNGPTIALPQDIAQERDQRAKQERAGRQILDSLACAIYVQLASAHVLSCQQANRLDLVPALLDGDAELAVQAAIPMAAKLGHRFQVGPAPESPT